MDCQVNLLINLMFKSTLLYLLIILFNNNFVHSKPKSILSQAQGLWNDASHTFDIFYQQASTEVDELTLGLKDFFRKFVKDITKGGSVGCRACKQGLFTIKRASSSSLFRPLVIKAALDICKRKGEPVDVCKGSVDLYAPWVFKILQTIDFDKDKDLHLKQLFCFALDNTCPYPEELKPNKLVFSNKQFNSSKQNYIIPSENKKLRILQLSDIHIDHLYETGAEADCKAPICCQRSSSKPGAKIKRPASKWGDYNCDIPQRLFQSMLDFIAKELLPIDLVIFTGDIPAHDVWNQSSVAANQIEKNTFKLLEDTFKPLKIPVIPTIGNHEAVPANLFPSNSIQGESIKLYSELSDMWTQWLPKEALTSLKKIGVYSVESIPGLKVISLNTNMCYLLNFWLISSIQKDNQDPNFILHWLIQELNDAESNNKKVYIIGHVPPAHPDCFPYWSDGFHQIINRYSHIIKGQFYGHTHLDQFQLFYKSNQTKQESTAINVAYISPSVTTFKNINSGFRMYNVGAKQFGIYDTLTYIFDLKTANENQLPNWKLEYNAREFFRPRPYDNMELTPQWWHRVINKLETKPHRLELYYSTMYKQAHQDTKCDDKCRKRIICNLRASNSSEACLTSSPISRH